MIPVYFVAIAILSMGIVVWYLGDYAFTYILDLLETRYPSYYAGSGPDFIVQFITYMPLICILIPVLIYVIVQSQKPKGVYQ